MVTSDIAAAFLRSVHPNYFALDTDCEGLSDHLQLKLKLANASSTTERG